MISVGKEANTKISTSGTTKTPAKSISDMPSSSYRFLNSKPKRLSVTIALRRRAHRDGQLGGRTCAAHDRSRGKNYLFVGSDANGERAAIYRQLGAAKLNGLDPELYLRHVLERITRRPANRLQALLHWISPPSSHPSRSSLNVHQANAWTLRPQLSVSCPLP